MKKVTLLAILVIILMCSCEAPEPSEGAIQTAIIQTQQAEKISEEIEIKLEETTNTPELTSTPEPTDTPESTNTPEPTNTLGPTNTPEPTKETFIITTGNCLGYEDRYIPSGDPVGFEYCDIDERRQTPLSLGDTVTYSSFMPFNYPSFCAIHTLDGEYIMSDVDVDGLGEAACTLRTSGLTNTPETPKDTYIVTKGECLGYEDRYIPSGDPVGFEYCDIDERRQMTLVLDDTVTYSSFMPFNYPSFCAIHTLDGEYIMSDVDVDGLGEAVCALPTSGLTSTPEPPKDTYIVTSGECLGYEDRYIPSGDPVGFEYCDIDERRQMNLVIGDTVTYSSFMPFNYPSFCAIHTLDGEYIMSDVDVDGLGEAVCTLP